MSGKGARGHPKDMFKGPSSWNRLKTANEDPLDSVGLPSRGDDRFVLLLSSPRAPHNGNLANRICSLAFSIPKLRRGITPVS